MTFFFVSLNEEFMVLHIILVSAFGCIDSGY